MENAVISIIVTVHNSEKYLEECLESVCGQTFKNIEILCVDGGSTDHSPEILQKFQQRDSRVKIIIDKNTSYGHKVNVGIKSAVGEYVGILESDDKMKPDMLEKLYKIVMLYYPDMVDAPYFRFFEVDGSVYGNTIHKYSVKNYNQILDGKENIQKTLCTGAIWSGIYKRSFLLEKDICLNESPGASFQDTSFGFLTGILAETKYHLGESLYCYRIDNVGSSVKDNKKIYEIIGECNYLKTELEKRNIKDESIWQKYYEIKYSTYYWNYNRLNTYGKERFLKKYVEELQKDIQGKKICRAMFSKYVQECTYALIDDLKGFICKCELNKSDSIDNIVTMIKAVRDREIVIFGAGVIGKQVSELFENHKNVTFCDNALGMQGLKQNGITILSPEEACNTYPNAVFIIANTKHYYEMKEQLLGMNIQENNIFIYGK